MFRNHWGNTVGLYLQDEFDFGAGWKVTTGLRGDYFHIDSLDADWQLNPKLGLVWRYVPEGALRASLGQGFRAPSIAEAYTSTTAAGLRVIPNPALKPERSMSTEIGLNQALSQSLILDVALFNNEYWELIEGTFTEQGFIQFRNVTRARTNGLEISATWKILALGLGGRIGYTYTNPRDLNQDCYLTYRPRHILYNHLFWQYGRIQIGADYRYLSKYDRIDQDFSLVIQDAEARVDAHVVDLRCSLRMPIANHELRCTLQINNLLQYHYVDLVGSIAPIRHFVFSLEKSI